MSSEKLTAAIKHDKQQQKHVIMTYRSKYKCQCHTKGENMWNK